jgi:hypothetical protein
VFQWPVPTVDIDRETPDSADRQIGWVTMDKRRVVGLARAILLAVHALCSAGCSDLFGPERMPVTRVKGVVAEAGRPLSHGWIEFFPVDGTVGNPRSARLRPDGSFEADKVAVGLNLIRLVNTDISNPGAERLFGAFHSPIRRVIAAEGGPPLSIDVWDEATRLGDPRSGQTATAARGQGDVR